ncbi:leucyl aminopeptidase [uncultured Thiodictyon sp.]|uniref:leucyl aminopeptidase n=1 Tax=uncultured Thiodictyon sp. TaxID=1846217 RepID=UPI0025EC8664|nr:leucyl aminopeptidase [uncultured Thiodictyon sp.]
MEFKIKSGDLAKHKTPCLVLGVFEKRKLAPAAELIDQASGGRLTELLKKGDLDGETGRTLMLYDLPGVAAERVLLVGCGKRKEATRTTYRQALAASVDLLQRTHAGTALSTLPEAAPEGLSHYLAVRDAVTTAAERVYRYSQTKDDKQAPKTPLRTLTLWVDNQRTADEAEQALRHGAAIAAGVTLARELGNLPGNVCTPSYLADQAHDLATRFDKLSVEVLEEAQMEELGMGALLCVSRGSRQPAKLIVFRYAGAAATQRPVVLVGKGLTFDAGGISLKPGADMDEMKYDMCGGASVFGAVQAACELDLPIHLIGVVPASENLPDGDANKPGDIVKSLSGQTIEVLNTDAEGRLILCDALTYSERFNPDLVIDVATLTGACVVALGKHASGLFTANDALAGELQAAGETAWDRVWRLPLWEDYQSQLDSNFADMANIGGRDGGAITAACFLSRYTKKFPWAHVDIAGTAWLSGKEKGGTGRPVPFLVQLLLERSGVLAASA